MKRPVVLLTLLLLVPGCGATTPPNTNPGAGQVRLETNTLKWCDGKNLLYLHGSDLEVLPNEVQCKDSKPLGDPKTGQVQLETATLKWCDGKHLMYLHGGNVEVSSDDVQCK